MRARQNSPEHIALISAGQKAARTRHAAGEGFIYVAAVVGTDAVKVGFSLRPERRVEQLGRGFRLIGQFPASIRAERRFHATYEKCRHPDLLGREVYPRSLFRAAA